MKNSRLHGMDFCRAVFMCLGLFFHCGLIYGEGSNWRVRSDDVSLLLMQISDFIKSFRMEAFYLVSGLFFLLVYRKGREGFLQDRVLRAAVPMLTVGISLNLVMNVFSYNVRYEWGWGYIISGAWMGHLWFLGNLLVYFLLSYPLCRHIDASRQVINRNYAVTLAALLVLAVFGKFFANLTFSGTILFISFDHLYYYYPFFLMGMVSYSALSQFYALISVRKLPIYLLLYGVAWYLSDALLEISWSLAVAVELVSHFAAVLIAFSVLEYVGSRGSRTVRFISDSSYSVYLLHQPLLVVFYVLIFKDLDVGVYFEYAMLIVMVIAASLAFHHYVVKRTPLAKLLFNGVPVRAASALPLSTKTSMG